MKDKPTDPKTGIRIHIPGKNEIETPQLIQLVDLINKVYEVEEKGMWFREHRRISLEEMETIIGKGHLIVAKIEDSIVGCIHVHPVSRKGTEFGMLVLDPKHRRKGIGKQLVLAAEKWTLDKGFDKMRLILIYPANRKMDSKELLLAWYPKMGYEFKYSEKPQILLPHLVKLLREKCIFSVYEKILIQRYKKIRVWPAR